MDTKTLNKLGPLIGHITPADGNIFLDIGFSPEEATKLKEQADFEVDQCFTIKHQLMDTIRDWMQANKLNHTKAAEILMVTRPRVTDLVNGKTAKFTIDMLMSLAARAGYRVTVDIARRHPA